MSGEQKQSIRDVCESVGNDRTRLLDVLLAVQDDAGYVSSGTMDEIAEALDVPRVEVEGGVSFYAFLSSEPKGKQVIRPRHHVVERIKGADRIAESLEKELGIRFGETTSDGKFSLEYASCIGMSDQAPAALVNDLVVPRLGVDKATRGMRVLRDNAVDADSPLSGRTDDIHPLLIRDYGDGNNSHDLVRAAVHNNLRLPGPVIFQERKQCQALERALAMSPQEVIREVKTSRLRGRGGAGFPAGMKWEFARAAGPPPGGRAAGGDKGSPGGGPTKRYLVCNADEGEPGTFKDRVILTERPHLLFEGMAVAGYAIGADEGIVYLRAEYRYLKPFLEQVLEERREMGRLGKDILGRGLAGGERTQQFDFDIRIQMGAGAYICGEETALISSMEGRRGDPKTRPPFPAQKGYLGKPTSVNNVETLCCAARILEEGSGWFSQMGTPASTGTKLLSISGDCSRPGIYEVPFGTPLREVLEMCSAVDTYAVQVGGPSGQMVGEKDFDRVICFDDLATGGALMVFNSRRNVVEIASEFMRFFIHESCGYCTPCRVGNVLIKERLDKILAGNGEAADLEYLGELALTVKTASRCGLGQTAPHPVMSTLENFRSDYEKLLIEPTDGRLASFDIQAALAEAQSLTGRESVHFSDKN